MSQRPLGTSDKRKDLAAMFSKSGLKSSNIEKETFSTKNDVVLTYKTQNAYLSDSNLPL